MANIRQCLRILGYLVTVGFHLAAIVNMFFGQESDDPKIKMFRENRIRYLTGWNMFFQLVHAILGLTCEYFLIKNSKNKLYSLPKYLRGARDKLFTNIVFPGSMLVATIFWIIFTFDRELVFPLFLDQIISNQFNHILHTYIVPIALWELIFQPRYEPKTHAWNCLHIALHGAAYSAVLVYTYYEKGLWLYPILSKLNTVFVIPFIAIIMSIAYFYYFLQWRIVRLVHGEGTHLKSAKISGKSRKIR